MRRPVDLTLYLITRREKGSLGDFYHVIQDAVKGGITAVQLREKEADVREIVSIGTAMLSFLKPCGIPLILNDRVDVAYALGADGIHLGQRDLKIKDARAILGSKAIIGLSVETIEQAIEAQDEDVDYLAASPVFPTKTKPDCKKPWGLEGLIRLCSFSRHPVIAIGGINKLNACRIIRCGASGIAVVSEIFGAASSQQAAREMRKRIEDEKSSNNRWL